MKKIFTLVLGAVLAFSANAQDSFMLGMNGATTVKKDCIDLAGNTVSGCDGLKWSIEGAGDIEMYLVKDGKTYSGGNSNKSLNATFGKPIKFSNGAPNLVILPEGYYTDKIELIGYCNTADATSSFTVVATDGTTLCESTGAMPNVVQATWDAMTLEEMPSVTCTLSKAANSFYISNGGKQPVVYIKVYKGEAPAEGPEVVTPNGNTDFNLVGMGSVDYGKTVATFKSDMAYNEATNTLTFANFLGGNADLAVTIATADPLATPTYDTKFLMTPVAGVTETDPFYGYKTYILDGLKDKAIVIEKDETNYVMLTNIRFLPEYSEVRISMTDKTLYNVVLYLYTDFAKWDAAANAWGETKTSGGFFNLETSFKVDNGSSAIESIEAADENAPVEYFNIQGMRINEPAAGQFVIRRQGSKVSKMIVR